MALATVIKVSYWTFADMERTVLGFITVPA